MLSQSFTGCDLRQHGQSTEIAYAPALEGLEHFRGLRRVSRRSLAGEQDIERQIAEPPRLLARRDYGYPREAAGRVHSGIGIRSHSDMRLQADIGSSPRQVARDRC